MPSLLTIPREIRDEIYEWALQFPLASSFDRSLQRQRKRVTHTSSDPESYFGEEIVRYPGQTTLPPTHGLLRATRQLRAEFLDTVRRLGPVRYKVDLSDRKDNGLVSPTWISVPIFTDKVDILEAHWRIRAGKTSSIATFVGDDIPEFQGQGFSASLAMLQRFVERGVYLLSKKKRRNIHIGLLAINMDTPPEMSKTEAEESVAEFLSTLEQWMIGTEGFQSMAWDAEAKEREDAQFRVLAEKIDRLEFSLNGILKREFVLDEMLVKRDQEAAERMQREYDEVDRVEVERIESDRIEAERLKAEAFSVSEYALETEVQ
jgi:hypothetical protein